MQAGVNDLCRSLESDEDLDEAQRRTVATAAHVRVFAVVSWGCAGTAWLAKALNAHPDIFCAHSANHTWSQLGGGPLLDGYEYLRLLAAQSSHYPIVGDVHGVARDQVPRLRAKFGSRFTAAIFVRDPLPRLRSQIALFRRFNYEGWGDLSYVDSIAMKAGCNLRLFTPEQRCFFHGVNMLNTIVEEWGVAPIYRLEDISSDPSRLAEFATNLADGSLEGAMDWAERAIAMGKVNQHSARAAIAPFDDFEQAIIRNTVKREAWTLYEKLGYAIPDFIR